jgi:nucleotide-binding universal stress UspA family protein
MQIKDILVQVDDLPAYPERLEVTLRLARRFGARVTGGYVVPAPDVVALADSGAAAVALATALAERDAATAAAAERFRARLRGHELLGEWRAASGFSAFHLARWAATADLVVLGQSDPDHPALEDPEAVVLACGRPTLVVPYAGRFETIGGVALVAWNGSREACRAAHDALALMAPGASMTVLSVNPDADAEPTDRLVRHLERHGLAAKADEVVTKELSPAEVALSRAADLGADLIVMGAYGHSRLRELILGGMTRDMFRHMTVPVLAAH